MHLHTTTDYAIRIMIEVAKGQQNMSSTVISEYTGISQKYLKKVALRLKKAEIKGRNP